MHCFFVGGPLDGELLDSDGVNIQSRGIPGTYKDGVDLAVTTAVVPLSKGYYIANGIARHESVSEEEVARRVHGLLNPPAVVHGTLLESGWGDGEYWASMECPQCGQEVHINDTCRCGLCWNAVNGSAYGEKP